MTLWTTTPGEALPVGGKIDAENFARWLREQFEAAEREEERVKALGGWPWTETAVRTVARWRRVFYARQGWLEYREAERAGKPGAHRLNFERSLCAHVVVDAGAAWAFTEMLSGGRKDTDHTAARLETDHEWSCRILAEYAGVDWQAVKACGESQEQVLALLANR